MVPGLIVGRKGDTWDDIVRRAESAGPRRVPLPSEPDLAELQRNAAPWDIKPPRITLHGDGVRLGDGEAAVDLPWSRIKRAEPVDPWPSLDLLWVDHGQAYRTILTPTPLSDREELASEVEVFMEGCARHGRCVTAGGWLDHPVVDWDEVDELPDEREETPDLVGYRSAPQKPEHVVARRQGNTSTEALLGWLGERIERDARRLYPLEAALTDRHLFVRSREGKKLRLPLSLLRTSRKDTDGDTVYVFGRNTEVVFLHRPGCELMKALDARLA